MNAGWYFQFLFCKKLLPLYFCFNFIAGILLDSYIQSIHGILYNAIPLAKTSPDAPGCRGKKHLQDISVAQGKKADVLYAKSAKMQSLVNSSKI